MSNYISIPMNAARICDGLSKIGHTPPTAITDIIDNSVQANATEVHVIIIPEREDASLRRRNNVKEYIIIDNGDAMTEEEIVNALTLGASPHDYRPNSLSKFGLGLKSASFSQGEVLEVISSKGGDAPFLKYVVSLERIREMGDYVAKRAALTSTDKKLISDYLKSGRGTIVRIASVRMINHPSIKSTIEELQTRVGVIYYYMMIEVGLKIFIGDHECEPFDPLFVHEADENGNLDESVWDGKSTRWIQKPKPITLDAEHNIKATIEVTQLPHPPTFGLDGREQQAQARDKYMIGAGNYGFYVYRNRRLLSWAESFGIIPQDQDYYAFRGRLIVDETADETLNIDVKKSHVQPSDEAWQALDQLADEYKRKSRKAWQRAGSEIRRITGENTIEQTNVLIQRLDISEEDFLEDETEQKYEESKKREEEILDEQDQRIRKLVEHEGSTEEDIEQAIVGEWAARSDRIFLVDSTEDFVLWEPYFDAEKGTCVRVNRLHRFASVIYEDNSKNMPLIFYVGTLLLQLAKVEVALQKYLSQPRDEVRHTMLNFRIRASSFLAEVCRQLDEDLPRES